MRQWALVKVICCLELLLVPYALADESADRLAIERTIVELNQVPRRGELFIEGAEISELESLRKLAQVPTFGTLRESSGQPTVTIFHEPWGEATINFPETTSFPMEILNPRIVCRSIRFITPDAAVAEGTWTYKGNRGAAEKPLLFVMKRQGGRWRIASLHPVAGAN